MTRSERIREFRLRQPVAELRRKAEKSRERANLHTREELDLAEAKARELSAHFDRTPE